MRKIDYNLLIHQGEALIRDVPYPMANLANLSALLYTTLEDINWAGFYLTDPTKDLLALGPFQGNTACTIIPFGKGVCGSAAQEDRTFLVPDVHAFKGHIACDSASRSEIVIPIHRDGVVIGVLDIDSPILDRFSEEDKTGLEGLVRMLEESMRHMDADSGSVL